MASAGGMILGAGVGILFAPAMGPFAIVIGAGLGLVAGALVSWFSANDRSSSN